MQRYFVLQSYLRSREKRENRVTPAGSRPLLRLRSAAEWLAYFGANAARCRPIPWQRAAAVPASQLAAIARSLQAWQLGETSDGNHLRAAAARYADRVGDPDYSAAV